MSATTPEIHKPVPEEPHKVIYNKVDVLTKGLVGLYHPDLQRAKEQLQELEDKQKQITQYMHEQNLRLARTHDLELQMQIFDSMKEYEKRLSVLKKDMKYLHEWAVKLRTRVERIQEAAKKAQ